MSVGCNKEYEWPCERVGSEVYYSIDLGPYLEREGDTLTSVSWSLPNGLVSILELVQNNKAFIKIRANYVGNHIVRFIVLSEQNGGEQTLPGQIKLSIIG